MHIHSYIHTYILTYICQRFSCCQSRINADYYSDQSAMSKRSCDPIWTGTYILLYIYIHTYIHTYIQP